MQSKMGARRFLFHIALSLISINAVFIASYYISFNDAFTLRNPNETASYKELLIIVNLLYLLIDLFFGKQNCTEIKNSVLFVIGYLAIIVFLQAHEFSRAFHFCFLSLFFVLSSLLKYVNVVGLIENNFWKFTQEHKVIIIGDEFREDLVKHINMRPGNHVCVAFLSDKINHKTFSGSIRKAHLNTLEEILASNSVDEVLIATSALPVIKIDNILKINEKYHAMTSILPPYSEYLAKQHYHTDYWLDVPIITVYHSKLSVLSNRIIKRAFDIVFSLVALVTLFPALCIIIIPVIWLSSHGPVFFKQKRKGHKQKQFLCYKFRTMNPIEENEQTIQASRKDPRVTSFGKTLRSTSIDEIPQFLNVLRGQMSIVGPRPHMIEHDATYEKIIRRYNVRFVTKPGITGWAQINGLRGSTSDPDLMKKRIEHDLWYIENWSLLLDIRIISRTTLKLLKGDANAY